MKEQIYKVVVNETGTFWYNDKNQRHRMDGPAREWANGDKQYWIDDKAYSETEFNKKIAKMNVKNVESTIISDLAELAAKHGYNLVKKD